MISAPSSISSRYQVAWVGVKNKVISSAAQMASLRSDAKYRDSGFVGRLQVLRGISDDSNNAFLPILDSIRDRRGLEELREVIVSRMMANVPVQNSLN
jgi:hypothetical protein